jgi:hypothetical protein
MTIIRRKPSVDTTIERQIITGMIISEEFLVGIQSIYRPGILRGNFTNIISQWCIDYYQKYSKPPGKEIEDVFRRHKKGDLDPAQADIIEDFLSGISHEYEAGEVFNSPYILDQAEEYFRLSSLESLRYELTKCIAGGRIEDGESLIGDFNRVTRIEVKGANPFSTESIVAALSDDSRDKLFRLHGALGDAIGDLERGFLFAVVGASGVGKTWWLMYIALRALFAGYKVLFVSLEMSEKQINRRIQHWATGLPSKRYLARHNDQVIIPVWDCLENQNGQCSSGCGISVIDPDTGERVKIDDIPRGYAPCTKCIGLKGFRPTSWLRAEKREPLGIASAKKKKEALDKISAVKNKRLRVVQFPSRELTIRGLNTYLDNLEYYEGFVPDVIVTDYADKFEAETHEYRHGINEIWEGHKALAQRRHCLVASASQSNTARTGKDIGQGDWAEDIRKLHLIDVGFAVNQTKEEKRNCIYRCEVVKQRHDEFDLASEIMVLNALHIGRPYISSCKIF